MGVQIVVAENNIEKVMELSDEAARRALEEIGLLAEGHAKVHCPVRTGNLRNSITHTADENSAYIGTNVSYGGYVELGTSRMRAQPYLKPAVENYQAEYRAVIKKNMSSS